LCTRQLQIVRRVHIQRLGIDDRDVDSHSGLQRTELLEPLAHFKRRGRQRHEALQRRAAVCVKAHMEIERAFAGWRSRPREVERAKAHRSDGRADRLDDVRVVAVALVADFSSHRADLDCGIVQQIHGSTDVRGVHRRPIPLDVDGDTDPAFRVDDLQRFPNAI
jgi:hypothetical protein